LLMEKNNIRVSDRRHVVMEYPGIDGIRILLEKNHLPARQEMPTCQRLAGFPGLSCRESARPRLRIPPGQRPPTVHEKVHTRFPVSTAESGMVGRALIRQGKTVQITNLIQTGAKEGMLTLEASLNRLVAERTITYETAVAKANNPAAIRDPAADPSAGPGYGGYGGYGGGPSQGRSGPTPTTPAGTKVRVPPPRPPRRR